MRKGKNIISFFISFILMFCLIITMILIFCRVSVENQNLYYKVIDENQTANEVTNSIISKVKYVMLRNNIPESLANNIVTKEEVRTEINNSVSEMLNYFSGKTVEMKNVNTDIYVQRIKDVMNKYIQENNIYLDSKSSKLVEDLSESVDDIVNTELQTMDLNKLSKSNFGNKTRSILIMLNKNKVIFTSFAVDIVLAIILVLIWRRSKSRGLAWIGYSFVSSGILVFLVGFSGYLSKFYKNLALVSQILKKNIALIIERYFVNLTQISVIFFLLGLFLMLIYWIHIYRKEKRKRYV